MNCRRDADTQGDHPFRQVRRQVLAAQNGFPIAVYPAGLLDQIFHGGIGDNSGRVVEERPHHPTISRLHQGLETSALMPVRVATAS